MERKQNLSGVVAKKIVNKIHNRCRHSAAASSDGRSGEEINRRRVVVLSVCKKKTNVHRVLFEYEIVVEGGRIM